MIADTKICPECAEPIKEAARVCRFCGYRFPAVDIAPTGDEDSALPAAEPETSMASMSTLTASPHVEEPEYQAQTAAGTEPHSAVFDTPPPGRRTGAVVVALLVAGLALGGGGFLLYESSTNTTGAGTTAHVTNTADGSAVVAPASPADSMSVFQVVGRERGVLGRSAGARRMAARALYESSEQGVADFTQAIAIRQSLIAEITAWDVPAAAARSRGLLVAALRASIVSDRDYLRGLRERLQGGTGTTPIAEGLQHDQDVTNPTKLHALRAYNALRAQLGLSPIPTKYLY